jgi:hypothetical protein
VLPKAPQWLTTGITINIKPVSAMLYTLRLTLHSVWLL